MSHRSSAIGVQVQVIDAVLHKFMTSTGTGYCMSLKWRFVIRSFSLFSLLDHGFRGFCGFLPNQDLQTPVLALSYCFRKNMTWQTANRWDISWILSCTLIYALFVSIVRICMPKASHASVLQHNGCLVAGNCKGCKGSLSISSTPRESQVKPTQYVVASCQWLPVHHSKHSQRKLKKELNAQDFAE